MQKPQRDVADMIRGTVFDFCAPFFRARRQFIRKLSAGREEQCLGRFVRPDSPRMTP